MAKTTIEYRVTWPTGETRIMEGLQRAERFAALTSWHFSPCDMWSLPSARGERHQPGTITDRRTVTVGDWERIAEPPAVCSCGSKSHFHDADCPVVVGHKDPSA
jgi:hypothetical protein